MNYAITLRAATVIAALIVFANPGLLKAEIYRCVQVGTVVFSDTPCDETAERYELKTAISVVEAPPDLEAIAEYNRLFVEQRQQRRQQIRAAAQARQHQQQAEQRRQIEYPPMLYQPVFYRANLPQDGRDDEPAQPIEQPDERAISARSRILSNRNTNSQRDILRSRTDTP